MNLWVKQGATQCYQAFLVFKPVLISQVTLGKWIQDAGQGAQFLLQLSDSQTF